MASIAHKKKQLPIISFDNKTVKATTIENSNRVEERMNNKEHITNRNRIGQGPP